MSVQSHIPWIPGNCAVVMEKSIDVLHMEKGNIMWKLVRLFIEVTFGLV